MHFGPFRALRAAPEWAEVIASPPYDVVTREEARRLAEGNPRCYLRISRPDLEFPDDVPPNAPEVYRRAAERLHEFVANGWLRRDTESSCFLYRMMTDDHVQWGLVGVCAVREYELGVIRRHERTRADAEEDRTRHTDAINANAGPVWLFWSDEARWSDSWPSWACQPPLYDLTRPDGTRHTVWRVPDAEAVRDHFQGIPHCYIADGHHRAAAAARVAAMRRASNPNGTGREEYERFLAAIFPAHQLRIRPYNRMLRTLHPVRDEEFEREVWRRFRVVRAEGPIPSGARRIRMHWRGCWYELSWDPEPNADPVARLDVSVLHDRLLKPVVGVEDPRRDPRLEFRGGRNSAEELAARVDRGEGVVAFSLHPVSIDELMAVADAGLTMPPKSTWFEPKLLSGLFIHPLDSANGQ